ncbi:MAG: MalY/PatB family protein [Treponemataceae bacterium]
MIYDFDEVIDRKDTQSSKWDNVGTRVGNPSALPMWVADTDFRCPQPVVDAIKTRMDHMIYGYPYVVPEFKQATIDWIGRKHGWKLDPAWIIFATGIVPVFNTMVQAFTEPGDEVIIQGPVYHPFGFAVVDNDRIISNNSLIYKDGCYSIDFDDLERRAKSPKAKLMILCNPHNPVGRVWTRDELARISEICVAHDVIMISDEIHSDLMLFGSRHFPVASLDRRYAMNTVTCYAPSKTFNTAGLRGSGIVIPNPEIRKGLEVQFKKNRSIQQNVFAVPAYVAAYTECDDYLEQLLVYLEENVRFLEDYLLEKMPRIRLVKPEAMYLMWLECSGLGIEGDALADFFVNKSLVAISRGDGFGSEGIRFVRLNIGCPRSTLRQALEQIHKQYMLLP